MGNFMNGRFKLEKKNLWQMVDTAKYDIDTTESDSVLSQWHRLARLCSVGDTPESVGSQGNISETLNLYIQMFKPMNLGSTWYKIMKYSFIDTMLSRTTQWQLRRWAWLLCFSMTLLSQTPQCHWHRWVGLLSVNYAAELDSCVFQWRCRVYCTDLMK